LGIVNTITLLVIQEVRRGQRTSSSKKATQTRPLILTGVPISEAVAFGWPSFRVVSRATRSMMTSRPLSTLAMSVRGRAG
jgi:hypothetical protein